MEPTKKQKELNATRKQVTSKSSLVILREQTANTLSVVNTLAGEVRLLRLALEGAQDMRAHAAQQQQIQDQAQRIIDLQHDLDEANEVIEMHNTGSSTYS